MNWRARNYRKHLMAGIRERMANTNSPSLVLFLWVALFDAEELSCR